ncbi:hypothetical protein NMY22_g13783 [Coprinellus aureogranulatus]|nr:hypothetical protein NMY22_g13783 [Coprinellus aureogranulatus]
MLSSSSAYILPSSSSARPSPRIPPPPSSRPRNSSSPEDQLITRSDSPLLGFGSDSSSPPRSPVPPPHSSLTHHDSLQPPHMNAIEDSLHPPHMNAIEDLKAAHRRSKSSEDTYDFPRTPGPEDGFLDAGSAFGVEEAPHSPSTKDKERDRDRNPLLFPGKGYKRDLPSGLDEVPLDSERLVYNTSSAPHAVSPRQMTKTSLLRPPSEPSLRALTPLPFVFLSFPVFSFPAPLPSIHASTRSSNDYDDGVEVPDHSTEGLCVSAFRRGDACEVNVLRKGQQTHLAPLSRAIGSVPSTSARSLRSIDMFDVVNLAESQFGSRMYPFLGGVLSSAPLV